MTPSPESSSVPASGGDRAPRYRYTAALAGEIELRWQRAWEERGTFHQPNPGEAGFDGTKPKFYCLDMFPYPSGAGLHVGHPEGYTATDMVCRLKRMQGFNVLHPMGWDAFGLPAEQYAIATGVHPAVTTKEAIDNFRRQLKRFGFCYDWSREFGTIDPEYYKWTQWIFLRLYGSWFDWRVDKARPITELVARLETGELGVAPSGEVVPYEWFEDGAMRRAPNVRHWSSLSPEEQRTTIDAKRLAYLGEQTVNWCPKLGTALANDEVIDGKSERGGYPVLRKPLRQWMLRITAYAQRLLDGLQGLDWPSSTRTMQEEWIGRSEGAEIEFEVVGTQRLRVFTTRPDTLFGATYMVVAPEHPLIDEAMARADDAARRSLGDYVAWARNRSDVERQESRDKTGCFTGLFAINPGTGERIPIWTADYVLMGYGFGAIMAVPAHDERDFEFAEKFGLPIRDVVYPRQTLAMRFFGDEATPDEQRPEKFAAVLADFLGWVNSQDVPPAKFGEALATVRTRRAADAPGAVIHTHAGEPMTGRAGESGERRGVVQSTWLDTVEAFGFTTHEALRERFDRAALASEGPQRGPYSGTGFSANSSGPELSINGLSTAEAKQAVIGWLERTGRGGRKVNFRLRDWVFSRQRYWGEPFPIVFDAQGRAHPVSEQALPVTLPALADYAPVESDDPQPLLAKAREWTHLTAGEAGVTTLPPDAMVVRETNTMPGSAGSSWYFLRYCDARNGGRFASREAEQYWMGGAGSRAGVDLYLGGSEHAVGHLLYARFWQNVLFDLGEVSTPEPFHKLFHQGLITSYAYQRADKTIVPNDEVREVAENTFEHAPSGERVTPVVTKMSKRYKNVVNPDDVIAEFGADTFRLYEMYMGPLEASKPWNTRDIPGLFRFLARLWRLVIDEEAGAPVLGEAPDAEIEKILHRLGAKVEQDIARLAFNTAIAACIEFVNAATSAREKRGVRLAPAQARRLALIVCPLAPHIAEELWAKTGGAGLASDQRWPEADPALLRDDDVEIAVQIQGKVRQRLRVPAGADAAAVEALVMADAEVQKHLAGKTVKKVVVVPGRMVNIVAG